MIAYDTAPRAGTRERGNTHGGTPRPDGRDGCSVARGAGSVTMLAAREHVSAMQSALTLAEEYGIPVFPCRPDKRPYTTHGFRDAGGSIEQIAEWWTRWPDALVGVPTGRASGLLVIDIDPDGAEWYRAHSDRLAAGRVHRTRRAGWHLMYRMPAEEIRCSASRLARGVDVRAEGGYVIWWAAHGYEAVGDIEDITSPPAWLLELLREPARETHTEEPGDGMIGPGGRNEYLSREAYRMRRQGMTVEQITAALDALNRTRCAPPLDDDEVRRIASGKARIAPEPPAAITVDDFAAYMPAHQYIFIPSRELWPGASVNARVPPVIGADGKSVPAAEWLDKHRPVDQMIWAPGEPLIIKDRLLDNGGWGHRDGVASFNLYRPPAPVAGDPEKVDPWLDHVCTVFPDDATHIIKWLAHRVQRPAEKINHALVLGGNQGIGKDTLLEPLKYAVGPWNFAEVSPSHLLGRFNGFIKSVILRVSEARDLGEGDRYSFYDHMKVYTAAPPDVLRCDEKHIREHAVMNVCGVIITTNHKSDGIYLPADDRRHYVAWSTLTKDDFTPDYWRKLYDWYARGGYGHVAAYLQTLDLSTFDPKAPPPKTPAFYDIVDANRAPEDAELADVLDALGGRPAVTVTMLANYASDSFREWLMDRRNRRQIPHRLEAAGYVPVRNSSAADGLWKIDGKRQAVYARRDIPPRDQIAAAAALARGQ